MGKISSLVGLVGLLALGLFCFAGRGFAKEIDFSRRTDSSGVYEISFCARPSPDPKFNNLPGHMFVAFSHKWPDGRRDFTAIGHTIVPGGSHVAAMMSYWGAPVSGYLAEERYTAVKERCLVVGVNQDDYERSMMTISNPLAKMGLARGDAPVFESYKLGEEDCMTFAIGIAKQLEARGLKVPERGKGEFPISYIVRLITAN